MLRGAARVRRRSGSAKQALEMGVHEHAPGIQPAADVLEPVPHRVEPRKLERGSSVHLSPVRSPSVDRADPLDPLERTSGDLQREPGGRPVAKTVVDAVATQKNGLPATVTEHALTAGIRIQHPFDERPAPDRLRGDAKGMRSQAGPDLTDIFIEEIQIDKRQGHASPPEELTVAGIIRHRIPPIPRS